ncbi:DUF1592 domain-containing protein [Gemmata sp.]|uniref:DUF1592 domain-containing protein n=1 Tax=Gemmata sp. TaxID=1914242 RepID=UPI003F6EA780
MLSSNWPLRVVALAAGAAALAWVGTGTARPQKAAAPPADPRAEFAATVLPVLKKYCNDCHSTKLQKGHLDLERFAAVDDVRKDIKPWQSMIEQIETGEMPPKNKPQPTDAEKKQVLAWVRALVESEARARTGDPGFVPLRRLSNAEYDYTVRDLTGVDLRPTREFPADGAAGEGFTNAAEALTDVSPALFTKYLNAAKDISERLVPLPDGFRFSPAKTRRDWTDEGTAALRAFYAGLGLPADGKLPVQPYLAATVRHRDALARGEVAKVAGAEKLNAKYLAALWAALSDKAPSLPLDAVRAKWRTATEPDVPALAAEVAAWQAALWKTVRVGSYVQESWGFGTAGAKGYSESTARHVATDPRAADSVPLKVGVTPAPGQAEVVLHLAARDLTGAKAGQAVWVRPRLEGPGKPALLLKDYATYGPAFEVDLKTAFANSARYLAAAIELANNKKLTPEDAAKTHGLDAAFLKKWAALVAVEPHAKDAAGSGRNVPVVALELLDEKTPPVDQFPAIKGWRKKGTELPVVLANPTDKAEQIPGRVSAKTVAVHPMPKEFVAVAWKSPVAASVKVTAKVAHAHPACGNGVAWWFEHRRGDTAGVIAEGDVPLGGTAEPAAKALKVEKGDVLVLAVDAKAGDHFCDMTEVWLTVADTENPKNVWDLAADVVADITAGNPHPDKLGNKETWSFARGPSRAVGGKTLPAGVVAGSLLAKWRDAAADPKRAGEATKLAEQAQALLSGPRPLQDKSPDQTLYDALVASEGPLFQGIDVGSVTKPRDKASAFGLPAERFRGENLVAPVGTVTEVRLPAALFVGREFVADGKLGAAGDGVVIFEALTAPPAPAPRYDGKGAVVAAPAGAAYKHLVAGGDAFRAVFPLYVCFPQVVPTDEVVSLKMFHREDEPLVRLFLADEQAKRLDALWAAHRFVSRQPVAEFDYLPQFMAYTTQDTPKEFQQFFTDRKPLFQQRADDFVKEEEAAHPKQLDAALAFAERAFRRPLADKERAELRSLYQAIRGKGAPHDEALRGVVARVFVSPAFLFRIEHAPKGKDPAPVSDHELATRLSYFLWASAPDDELRALAAAGKLRDPKVLAAQTDRMLKDARLRALAIEFGTQWLHVRGFDAHNEKNEKLFPTFDAKLRAAIYEESILFFQDLFQSDRPVTAVLDADYVFVNDLLAKHYGIPGVSGPEFRRVDGARKHGRGGVLGLASVQAKESGASRTSPVLRGNWVVETLLGEKLPKPPPNVPQLPEEEGADKLTTRQLVERHTRQQECAVCHVRIDPFGFALEKYDPIGRFRERDSAGQAVDAKSKLKDGTEFEGIDGIRDYLLAKKKDVVVRLFCKRLLGYALGRAVTLSDTALLDEMVAELNQNGGRVSAAVRAIVRSPQFRTVRGADFAE